MYRPANPVVAPEFLRHPAHLLAFGFGAGLARKAPGTAGTVVAVPLYLALQGLSPSFYLALVAILFAAGVAFCRVTARDLGVHDHPGIVWDEIVGYLLTMTAAPQGWWWVLAGFALFRLFDILKPWPIRGCDRRIRGGFGIMFDDVLAAGYSWVILKLAAVWLGGS